MGNNNIGVKADVLQVQTWTSNLQTEGIIPELTKYFFHLKNLAMTLVIKENDTVAILCQTPKLETFINFGENNLLIKIKKA